MNTTKTVFNKLYNKKTELETHKVELGVKDDYMELFNKLVTLDTNIDKNYALLRTEINKAGLQIEKSEKLYQKTEKIAKELGLDINEVIPTGAKSRINNINKKVKSFRKL